MRGQSITGLGAWLVCLLLAILSSPSTAFSHDGGWGNLSIVTRRRDYDFIERNGRCVSGPIVALDSSSVTVTSRVTSSPTIFHPDDLIRVTDGGPIVHNALYNGKSSWADIGQANPRGPRERILVVTSDGKDHIGKTAMVTEGSLTLTAGNHRETVAKGDVLRASYLRMKPLSAGAEYMARESAILVDPELWWDLLFLGKVAVPLYDASAAQDNSDVKCAVRQ